MINEHIVEKVLRGLDVPADGIRAAMPILLGKGPPAGEVTGGLVNMRGAMRYMGGVSRFTIMRSVNAGLLRATRYGRRVMFSPDDLHAFKENLRSAEDEVRQRLEAVRRQGKGGDGEMA